MWIVVSYADLTESDVTDSDVPKAKKRINFSDLMTLPKRVRPTGPMGRGRGRGRGRGGRLPNQLLTSPETLRFIELAEKKQNRVDEIKKEKDIICKKALAQNAKAKRIAKKKP